MNNRLQEEKNKTIALVEKIKQCIDGFMEKDLKYFSHDSKIVVLYNSLIHIISALIVNRLKDTYSLDTLKKNVQDIVDAYRKHDKDLH